MTTDITELAQRMKAAAVRAKTATEEYASGHMSVSVCYAECEEFNRLTDGPDNIIALVKALVEALEKAQQVDEELCKLLPPGVEYMDPPDGGDVTPLEGVRRMVADYRQRIAGLEESHAQVIQSRDHYKRMLEEGLKQLAEPPPSP